MKSAYMISVLLLCASPAWADQALWWDRNSESDMKEYRVYLCLTAGCTAKKSGTPAGTVPQPTVGVAPTWPLPAEANGAAVVTAVDLSGNESPESNMVFFDTKAPAAPSNARTIEQSSQRLLKPRQK